MEIKECENILKLFGVEIPVPPPPEYSSAPTCRRQSPPLPHDDVQENRVPESHVAAVADVITEIPPSSAADEEEVRNPPPPPEYSSSTPTGSRPVTLSPPDDVQEKRVPESQAAAPAADVITGNLHSSSFSTGGGTKIPMNLKPPKKRKFDGSHDYPVPLEEIPGLMKIINNSENENENGSSSNSNTRPVFLYRKKLEESDVKSNLNRMMVNGEEKLLEFLTEEERRAVLTPRDQETRPRGFELTGVDKNGKLYNLHYILWGSLKKTAINKQWNTLVSEHNAKKGDWVEIWGYRVINNNNNNDNDNENENGPRIVVNFRKTTDPNMVDDKAAAGSSSMQ